MHHVLLSNLSILVTFKRNRVINYSIKTEPRDLSSSMGKIAKGNFTVASWLCQEHQIQLHSWQMRGTWCFHQEIGIDVNPELWCRAGPYEGHLCRCSVCIQFCFSTWWWWIRSKSLLAWAPVSFHCVSGASSKTRSYGDFSTWPSVVVDKKENKATAFSSSSPEAVQKICRTEEQCQDICIPLFAL